MEAEGDVGFGHGLRRNPGFVAVGGHFFPVDEATRVLGADDIFRHGLAGQRTQGLHDFDLLVAHGVGAEIDGRFHRGEAEKLEEMVLHHVAQGAGILVVSRARFDAERFARRDLHIVDIAAVPQRFEDGVGEAQDHDVLRGLLAEVVVDAESVALGKG